MSGRLTEADLAAIEACERAATKGPWIWGGNSANGMPALLTAHKPLTIEARYYGADCVLSAGWMADINGKEADQVFIAHARQDIPALLAEVRRLRKAIATIRADKEATDDGA